MNRTVNIALIICILVISVMSSVAFPKRAEAFAATANDVRTVFWDPPFIPHYGAVFPGAYGCCQWYTGSSNPPGYGSWDWWPSNIRYVLLLEKNWLLFNPDGWNPSNHHAYLI